MYIGEVSKLIDASVKTIRFYEEQGLISKPAR
ncbi:MAG: MerR family DNA-binding transcriptional regulator [Saccharospirillaceae bacterium]|nr:MerR family DNA-binding transcriptional regulator [Saccharospirillaceae bacterium]